MNKQEKRTPGAPKLPGHIVRLPIRVEDGEYDRIVRGLTTRQRALILIQEIQRRPQKTE